MPSLPAAVLQSIVIPCLDEATRLPATLHALLAATDPTTVEIVVVDDGSTDDTADVARAILAERPRWQVCRLDHNRGKGAAVRAGVAVARGRQVILLDADNATDLDLLEPLGAALSHTGAVIGSRTATGAEIQALRSRRWLGNVFNQVVRWRTGLDQLDTQCGFKGFDARVVRAACQVGAVDGFAYDVELLVHLRRWEIAVTELPVRWHHVAGSRIGWFDPFRMAWDVLRIRPMRHDPPVPVLELGAADPALVGPVVRWGDLCLHLAHDELLLALPLASPGAADAVAARLQAVLGHRPTIRLCALGDLPRGALTAAMTGDPPGVHRG